MKKILKGALIGILGLGLAFGLVAQADALPGYTKDTHPYDDSCKDCHKTDPYAADNGGDNAAPADNDQAPAADDKAGGETKLPQTGAGVMYLNYLAGAGLLVPGAALLASRKKQR